MSRAKLANEAIDRIFGNDPNFTRDVPAGFIARTFPFRDAAGRLLVVPARESDNGRGSPLFDLYGEIDGIEVAGSIKVSFEGRAPRNGSIAGGKAEHLKGLILAAEAGTFMPVLQFWSDAAGGWYRCCYDLGEVLRDNPVRLTDGWRPLLFDLFPNVAAVKQVEVLTDMLGYAPEIAEKNAGGIVAISPMKRGGGKYIYLNVKINHAPAGLEWDPIDYPRMPENYAEMLEWMGVEDMVIG